MDNGTDVFVNVRAKGETRIFWASDWDIERGDGSSAYELRFGEQEYTVNEMKQNIVILNQSDIRNRVTNCKQKFSQNPPKFN